MVNVQQRFCYGAHGWGVGTLLILVELLPTQLI